MRKLMWFGIGFVIACAVGAYLVSSQWLLYLGFACLMGCFGLLFVHSPFSRKTLCVALGIGIGLVWFWLFDIYYLSGVRNMDGQTVFLQIEVTDHSRNSEYGITAEGKTEINGKVYRVQFYNNEQDSLSPGDQVKDGFILRYTAGGSRNPTYHSGKGIFLLCYPKGSNTATISDEGRIAHLPAIWRYQLLNYLERLFPEDTVSFVKALLLGDTRSLGYETKWALKTSGVYHIVAVSGMHVSIVFALVCMLCINRRVLVALFGLPTLLLFAAITGFSPSVVRACIMQALVVVALLANREYDPPTALAAAVMAILVCNPLSITSVSLQLSAGCMMGIFLFAKPIYNYLLEKTPLDPATGKTIRARLTRWAASSVSVTLGAMSVTTPLCAIYFGSVSVSGILTNLLILWLIGILFYCVIAVCLLGAVWLPLGKCIGWVISWLIRGILWVTDMISRLPVSSIYTCSIYIVAFLIFAYVLLTVFYKSKKKHPLALTCCLIVGLLGAVACSWVEPRLDDYRITAVDVGQGQCLLLQNEGKYYIVDCGGDSGDDAADAATRLLLSQGIFRLDGLILTHYDADHAGGVWQLLSKIPADVVYLPEYSGENDLRDTLVAKLKNKICWVQEDQFLEDVGITIYPSADTTDANESSLCVLFQPDNCDILITGDRSFDGEQELLEHTQLPDIEILVAGHHGSATSTSWELLHATRPELVLISVGADNSYGHPTQETLERLELFGCDVYRTDLEGTIIFRG